MDRNLVLGLSGAIVIVGAISVAAVYADGGRVHASGNSYDWNKVYQNNPNYGQGPTYNNVKDYETKHGANYGQNGLPNQNYYSPSKCRVLKPQEATQFYNNGARNLSSPQQQQQPSNYYVPGSNAGGSSYGSSYGSTGAASYGSNTSTGQPYYTQTGK